jgi:flavin reductase (DIM6/NTAB) family NADH-FMN oxidoreductase RutF
VKESPVHLECRLHSISKVGRNDLVFGEIISFVIADELLDETGRLDRDKYEPIARLAGNHYMGEYKTFELAKIADKEKLLGFDDTLR